MFLRFSAVFFTLPAIFVIILFEKKDYILVEVKPFWRTSLSGRQFQAFWWSCYADKSNFRLIITKIGRVFKMIRLKVDVVLLFYHMRLARHQEDAISSITYKHHQQRMSLRDSSYYSVYIGFLRCILKIIGDTAIED